MQALEFFRSATRYAAARAVGDRAPGLIAGPLAPLRLANLSEPEPPGPSWGRVAVRLSGICGSDLATLSGNSSMYLSPLVSLPFVPGHEVVGELAQDVDDIPAGTRVVLDPVLSCSARGLEPCRACVSGATNRCQRVTSGHVSPGLQTGYCADTGGGWSGALVAHRSQLHPVPDSLDDAAAVLVEPLACAVHAALRAEPDQGDWVLVVGAGTLGALCLLALRELTTAGRITVVAKHPRQRDLALALGASEVVAPAGAARAIRRSAHAFMLTPERGDPFLTDGVDVALDCVGSEASLDLSLRTCRGRGRVVLVGLPSGEVDLTPVWYRELEVTGAYASGAGELGGRSAFDIAVQLAGDPRLQGLVDAVYPLARWRDAVDHALAAGRLGTIKVAFDPRIR
ncbi:MAG: zinc-dependent alcohol dehydrogenase [Actinomycetota bacterium]